MASEQLDVAGRIVQDPGILAGKPVVNGTRIAVDMVLEYLEDNPNLEELFADYPELTLADVQACLGYARKAVQETTGQQGSRLRGSRAATRP